MPKAYHIVRTEYAGNAFDGELARIEGGRWSSIGTRIVYTAGSLSLAIMDEALVQLQQSQTLANYIVFELDFPDGVIQEEGRISSLADWESPPPIVVTREFGDAWIKDCSSAVLKVPSFIIRSQHNFLINPAHADFSSIRLSDRMPLDVDPRLFLCFNS